MVSSNILQRTFHVKFGTGEGTCFTIDLDGRHYIVTAAHVVEGIKEEDELFLNRNNSWHPFPVRRVGVSSGAADIAVLAPMEVLSPLHPLGVDGADAYLSQDVYFLGFPYGLQMDFDPQVNRGYPLPLVKKGIISALPARQDGAQPVLIDGHNNPGFSGGPVVFVPHAEPRSLKVHAVISGFRGERLPVLIGAQATSLSWLYNTGIIVATDITVAIMLIRSNPIGCKLPQPA